MSTIITRAGKGSPLTNDEVDANFSNLNGTKVEIFGSQTAKYVYAAPNAIDGTPSFRALVASDVSGLGTMSSQNANAVAITGGAISGTSITVKDNVFTLQDDADPTKQANFQLSGLTTGTTFTYTLPANSMTLAGLSGGQTFSGATTFNNASLNFGTSAATSTGNFASGATTTGNTKNVNVGTGGLSGSTTNITVGSANGSTTTMLGTTVIGGVAGSQSLQVNNVASAVNYAQIVGAVTGGSPIISALGTDANISLFLLQKGTGTVYIGGNGTIGSMQVSTPASMVNSFGVFGNTTGNAVSLTAIGADTNISMGISGKGTGAIQLYSGSNESFRFANLGNSDFTNYYTTSGQLNYTAAGGSTNVAFNFSSKGTGSIQLASGGGTQAVVSNTASAVNYLNLTGAATGAAPTISAQGSDANIGLVLSSKGTGVVALGGSTVANSAAQFVPTASSVNFLQFTGGATGISPSFVSSGADASVGFNISTKANGNIAFYTNNFGNFSFIIKNVASAVNYIQTQGAVTTGAPELSAQGSDANINLKLTPKGTGVLQFGTYTAGALSPTGYITITDAGGTSRRLLVG